MAGKLSILIPTIPGREGKLSRLIANLQEQRAPEILVFPDLLTLSIGEKRNHLLAAASCDFVAFVDDDDQIAPDYVSALLEAISSDPDVVCFQVMVRNRNKNKVCTYHPSLPHGESVAGYSRKPNHLMAWKRSTALLVAFPPISHGEDTWWAARMVEHAKNVAVIDRVLYEYTPSGVSH